MIGSRELQQLRAEWTLDIPVIEKDYVLGWMLAGIAQHPELSRTWVFKGGTCLRKCYYETFRFSEDLDFTVIDGGRVQALSRTSRLLVLAPALPRCSCGLDTPPRSFEVGEGRGVVPITARIMKAFFVSATAFGRDLRGELWRTSADISLHDRAATTTASPAKPNERVGTWDPGSGVVVRGCACPHRTGPSERWEHGRS